MKILHIVSLLDKEMGGSVIAAFDIATCLSSNNNEIENHLIGPYFDSTSMDYFHKEYPQLKVTGFPVDFFKHSFVSTDLTRWLKSNMSDFDIVHCHSIFKFPTLIGAHLARKKGIPLVISPHNSLDPYDLRKKYLIKKLIYGPIFLRPIIKYASILCTTPLEQERMVTFNQKPIKKFNIPLPVKINHFDTDISAAKEQFGIKNHDRVLLFMSRIDRKKGIDLLLKSLSNILASGIENIKLVIAGIGDADYQKELELLTEELSIKEYVKWAGFVTGSIKASLLELADIFVLPSYNENFGIVVAEAMKYGKTILISNEVYIHPILNEHNAAAICKPNVDSVTNHLKNLLSNNDLCEELGKNAKLSFKVFEIENLAIEYQTLFKSLANSDVK